MDSTNNTTVNINIASTSLNDTIIANVTTDELNVLGPQYHKTVRIVILASMIAISLLGNTVVCWRLFPSRRRRYPKAKVLFLNLAIADLLVTTITMTSQMVWEIMGRLWVAGDVFCRIFKLMQTFALVSSTYMLVSIALDRHQAIVKPLARCPKPTTLAATAWLASLIPSVPNIYVFRQIQAAGQCYCASLFYTGQYPLLHRQLYMAFIFLAVFIVPFCLLVGLYTRILVEIWRQSSAFSDRHQANSSLPRAKVKTLKMTLVIFFAFILTNLPYVIQEMVLAFGDPSALDTNIVALFGVISASNSALNPYIYLMFHATGGCFDKFQKLLKAVRNARMEKWQGTVGNGFMSPSLRRKVSFTSSTRQSVLTRAPTLTQSHYGGHGDFIRMENPETLKAETVL